MKLQRVICLYRVSTKKQVDKNENDIPIAKGEQEFSQLGFDSATLEQKKMIACHLFKRIEVGRDYQITVELNMTYQQFCTEWSNGEFWKKTAAV